MAITQQKKIKDREIFFKKALGLFLVKEVPALLAEIKANLIKADLIKSTQILEITHIENPEKVINKSYWDFVNKHVRPLIASPDGKPEPDYIDVYKMLSATEYTIMAIKPLFLIIDGKKVDYTIQDWLIYEYLINAHFAFTSAFSLLTFWDGYKKAFKNVKTNNALLSYIEDTEKRKEDDCMTIKDEHIKLLAFGHKNSNVPIFANSTWWRVFCLCRWIIFEAKVNPIILERKAKKVLKTNTLRAISKKVQ